MQEISSFQAEEQEESLDMEVRRTIDMNGGKASDEVKG